MSNLSEKQAVQFQLEVAHLTIDKLLNDINSLEDRNKELEDLVSHREDEREDFLLSVKTLDEERDGLLKRIKELNDGLASCEEERRSLFREVYGEGDDIDPTEGMDDTDEEKIKFMADNYVEPTINS